MAKFTLVLAGLYATTAFASPWYRNQPRGGPGGWENHHGGHNTDDWGWGKKSSHGYGQPGEYGSTTSSEGGLWGHGTTSACVVSTVTLPASSIYVTGHETTVTLPRETCTSWSTVVESSPCSSAPIGPVSASTVTQTSYVTRTIHGYNNTATEFSTVHAPGTTVTSYQ